MRRRRWNWKAFLLALMALITVSACSSKDDSSTDSGSARVTVQALSALDAYQVTLQISNGSLASPRTVTLTGGSTEYRTNVGGLPAGTGYIFAASATDRNGNVLYTGSAAADVIARQTVGVLITLLQANAPPPFLNAAPVIDSIVVSSASVAPGDAVAVAVTAHDPNAGDTISYAWTATGGTFASSTAASTTWTAPSTEGSYALTIRVADNRGSSTLVNTTVQVSGNGQSGQRIRHLAAN